MRKVIIIVIIACLVVAVIMSSIFIGGSKSEAGASASVSKVEGSMVVWNKERDQKLFETKDASAIGSVVTCGTRTLAIARQLKGNAHVDQ